MVMLGIVYPVSPVTVSVPRSIKPTTLASDALRLVLEFCPYTSYVYCPDSVRRTLPDAPSGWLVSTDSFVYRALSASTFPTIAYVSLLAILVKITR